MLQYVYDAKAVKLEVQWSWGVWVPISLCCGLLKQPFFHTPNLVPFPAVGTLVSNSVATRGVVHR